MKFESFGSSDVEPLSSEERQVAMQKMFVWIQSVSAKEKKDERFSRARQILAKLETGAVVTHAEWEAIGRELGDSDDAVFSPALKK